MMKNVLILLAFTMTASVAFAGDWSNWRGPHYNGSAEAKNLPVDFARDKHVKLVLDLPGSSAATPVILGDRIFITSTDPKNMKLLAICVDRVTGKILWSDDAGSGYQPGGQGTPINMDTNNNYASPSAVTDGKHVVFMFGNGDLLGYTLEGKRLWARNLQQDFGDFTFQWTYSASPLMYEGRLYVQVMQRDIPVKGLGKTGNESFLLMMDPATGKDIWKHIRPSNAQNESLESFATPTPYEHNGRKELILAGGDYLTGHDPATGKELWRWGTWNEGHREQWWRLVPTAVVGDGVIVVCAPKRAPVYAIQAGLTGDHSDKPPLWKSEDKAVASDVPTPAFAHGTFYVLNDQKPVGLSRVEPKTGKVLWSTPLPGRYLYRGSPTVADGKVYCINYHGDVTVIDAEKGDILHTTPLGDEDDDYTPATISVAGNQLFIRTQGRLYCIGQ